MGRNQIYCRKCPQSTKSEKFILFLGEFQEQQVVYKEEHYKSTTNRWIWSTSNISSLSGKRRYWLRTLSAIAHSIWKILLRDYILFRNVTRGKIKLWISQKFLILSFRCNFLSTTLYVIDLGCTCAVIIRRWTRFLRTLGMFLNHSFQHIHRVSCYNSH
jgi:hypothetical protein